MVWSVTLRVKDVNGDAVEQAELRKSTWAGIRLVEEPPVTIGSSFAFTVDDNVLEIVCELRHARFANLIMLLLRTSSETVWRWTDPARNVITNGKSVTIEAVLGRVRGAPTIYIPEDSLKRRATAAKQPEDEKVQRYNAEHPRAPPKPLTHHELIPD